MAGTDDDNSTLEWWGLAKILTFVVECIGSGSVKGARELLLHHLDRGDIRWRAWRMIHGSRKWTSEAAEHFFWRRDEDSTIDVDWKNENATRTGPVYEFYGSAAARVRIDGPTVTLTALLIQLCWNDVCDILRSLGYLAVDASLPSSPTGLGELRGQESPSSTTEQTQRKQEQRMSEVELARELVEIALPNGKWQTMKPGAVEHACDESKAVKKRLAELKRDMPKRDSFARATGHRK
jgi:hypothetical protein